MNKTLITFFTILFCITSSIGWSLDYKDLVERDGIYYKKFSDVPFTGKVNGKEQGLMKNGKKDGSWIQYHNNGQLFYKVNFKNGKEDGSWISYHLNGQLWDKGNWKNGNRDGSWLSYYNNGQLSYKVNFKNGKLEGSFIRYNRDGSVDTKKTGTYKNDIKVSD